ncbi:MAG TPA: F0F1 ATP synthase subunit alpha, partial [Planctomycetota bacterium]|nr:F0F1 ATP synthase subunit alpha [Planctomycetota bacterium]
IYAGTHGYLDTIPASDVPRFVTELVVFVRSNKPSILESIVKSKKIDDATETDLNEVLKSFSASFEPSKK